MPVLKPITGHTSCKGVFYYLTKNGRALASDYVNIDTPENAPRSGVFPWYKLMDETRENAGHNRPWGGRKPRTYMHYIVSPDPEDRIGIGHLRDLVTAWAEKHFGEYQCAIVYHDDNEGGIPHAHVVVNFTNLETGYKLHIDDPTALSNSLQALAKERSLRHFCDDREIDPDGERTQFVSKTLRPKSLQQEYTRRAEVQLRSQGQYSWVADIRARVKVARAAAHSEAEFRELLGALGVGVSDNSAKAARADWIYSLADAPTRRVSGEKLGLAYGRESLLARFDVALPARGTDAYAWRLADIAKQAVAVADLAQLQRLADAVTLIETRKIDSVIALESYLQMPYRRQAGNDLTQDEAVAAGELVEDSGMLPYWISSETEPEPETAQEAYAKTRPVRRSDGEDGTERAQQRDYGAYTQQRNRTRDEQER